MEAKSNSQLLQLGHAAVLESERRTLPNGLTQDAAYQKLRTYHKENAARMSMVEMFSSDPERFKKYQ